MSVMQLSPYNYERIEVVLKIIQATDETVAGFSVSQVQKDINKFNIKQFIFFTMYCTSPNVY